MKKSNKQSGFTLVEVIIATLISAVVGVLLLSIMVNNTGVFYKQSSKVAEGLGSNDSLTSIRSAIKQASAIAASYPVTGTPTYTSGDSQLVLRLASIDSSGNIIDSTYDYEVFYLSGGNLYLKIFPNALSKRQSADRVLSKYASSINFQYLNLSGVAVSPVSAAQVKVTLSLAQRSGANIETNISTTEANIRND
jgi:prepilin-type N-terminal cleavage/methylation domain-containing protein